MQAKTCWVLTVGVPGMDNQSIGLAQALGLEVVQKRIEPVAPWKHLPPQPQTEAKPNPVFQTQIQEMEKARAVEGQVMDAAQAQRKQIDDATQH